jgi:hypothetical protein
VALVLPVVADEVTCHHANRARDFHYQNQLLHQRRKAMGEFLSVSAFHDQSVESIASHTSSYASRHGVACTPMGQGEVNEALDIAIFAPHNRWTVVLWPQYFNIHDIELCRSLSKEMPSLASTIHVYDGDYWVNAVFNRGTTVSLFASVPEYFAESETDAARLKSKWSGNAAAISEALSVPTEQIAPYFVHLDGDRSDQLGKAFADDEFELWDFWVFVDFWRRLGIAFPTNVCTYQQRLRLPKNFANKLPCDDEL